LSNLYDTDFYQWTREQARLLSEGKWHELDVADLAEEIESLGKSERNALSSFLDVIVLHLLKLMYQPERTSRRWRSSIIEHRRRAHRRLRLSPSLRREVADMITDAYTSVRRQTAAETGLPLETFPETCPWTAEQVLDDDFFPR
jgi:hypothetical protein